MSDTKFRTATGEVVAGGGGATLTGRDSWQQRIRLAGERAPVHKILVSAGETTDKGHVGFLDRDAGYLITAGSKLHRELVASVYEIMERHAYAGVVMIPKEKGVYNFYVHTDARTQASDRVRDVCPNETTTSAPSGSFAAWPRL